MTYQNKSMINNIASLAVLVNNVKEFFSSNSSVVCEINQMCAVKYTMNEYEWITKSDQNNQQ